MNPQFVPDFEHRVSPAFAREAAECLQRGEITEALRLCYKGRERYPWYATAALVLGRCHEELGRTAEALLEYRWALVGLPDSRVLQEAVARVEQREREEFDRFAEQQAQILSIGPARRTFEEFTGEAGAGSARALQNRIASRVPRDDSGDDETTGEIPGEPGSSAEIVTVTLAEIYAAQGQYEEAVNAYRKLLDRRPDDADRFRKRIAVLESLAAASDTEKPLQE